MPPISRAGGRFAPLAAHYYMDERIDAATELGELLFIRGLAFCAGTLSDGFIGDSQVQRVLGMGLSDIDKRCQLLVEAGLWERDEDRRGYVVRNWLKWNSSREEIEHFRARDASRKRVARSVGTGKSADVPTESTRTPSGIRAPKQDKAKQINTTSEPTPSGSVGSDGAPEARALEPEEVRARAGAIRETLRSKRGRS